MSTDTIREAQAAYEAGLTDANAAMQVAAAANTAFGEAVTKLHGLAETLAAATRSAGQ